MIQGCVAAAIAFIQIQRSASNIIKISNYFPLFGHNNDTSLLQFKPFSMEDIYDLGSSRCTGDAAFVTSINRAPSNFCMMGIHPTKDLKRVIGHEWWWPWESEVVQRWANALSPPPYDGEYDTFLAQEIAKMGSLPLRFDEFSLERIMLGRWSDLIHHKSVILSQESQVDETMAGHPQLPSIIVVPSLIMHLQELLWGGHLAWNLLLPKECIRDDRNSTLPEKCEHGYGSITLHRRFWSMVRKEHHVPFVHRNHNRQRPPVHHAHGRRRPPLIVVHHSFVWDQPAFCLPLIALLEQPRAFVERVLIGTVEAQLKLPSASLGFEALLPPSDVWAGTVGDTLAASAALAAAKPSTSTARNEQRESLARKKERLEFFDGGVASVDASTSCWEGKPVLVTLPYPTGILSNVPFAEFSSTEHRPPLARSVGVLLDASLARKGGGGKVSRNWIRPLVHQAMVEAGAACQDSRCTLVCEARNTTSTPLDGSREDASELTNACGGSQPGNSGSLWETLVSSSFCLEPAGDTLTRSHFYLAVLSGCIPVIFDYGGVDDFYSAEATHWAWRDLSSSRQHGMGEEMRRHNFTSHEQSYGQRLLKSTLLRYEDFCIVLNATALRIGTSAAAELGDAFARLARLPFENPMRYQELRRNLDTAASAMRYRAPSVASRRMQGVGVDDSPDAFDRFEATARAFSAL